jgi:hypothetical protein
MPTHMDAPTNIQMESMSANLLTHRQVLQTAHSRLPPGLRLTLKDCLILLHVEQNRNMPYDRWPQELKLHKSIEKLRKRGYLHRGYWPTKYGITKSGFSLVNWIKSSCEHVATSAAA